MFPQHGLQMPSCPDSLRLLLIPSNPSPSSPVSSTVFNFPDIKTKCQSKSIAPPWSLASSHSHPLSISSPGGLSSLSDSTSPSHWLWLLPLVDLVWVLLWPCWPAGAGGHLVDLIPAPVQGKSLASWEFGQLASEAAPRIPRIHIYFFLLKRKHMVLSWGRYIIYETSSLKTCANHLSDSGA